MRFFRSICFDGESDEFVPDDIPKRDIDRLSDLVRMYYIEHDNIGREEKNIAVLMDYACN